MTASPQIPNRLVFVWLGDRFPLTNRIAIRSAVEHCRPDEVLLIADHLDAEDRRLTGLAENLRLTLVRPTELLAPAAPGFPDGAQALFDRLDAPAARANLLRLLELWHRGGVYLDTDTITVRDLAPLRSGRGFCGREVLVFPRSVVGSSNPGTWIGAGLRSAARSVCAKLPAPDRAFAWLEPNYPQAVNNAVLGACPHNAVVGRALARIPELSRDEQLRRFRLGTHLLQEVTGNESGPDMEVLPPSAFYPLGPEISIAWFRRGSAARLESLVGPETYLVHWYASLESRLSHPLDRQWIEGSSHDVAFSRLARPYVD